MLESIMKLWEVVRDSSRYILVFLSGCNMYGKKEFDSRESKNSLFELWTL